MRRRKQWIGFLVMVLGAALLLGPFIQGDLETRRQQDYVAELHEQLNRGADVLPASRAGDEATAVPAPTATPSAQETAVSEPTNTITMTLTPAPKETAVPEPTNTITTTLTPAPKETAAPEPTDTISATMMPSAQETAAPEPTNTISATMMPSAQETAAPEPTNTCGVTLTPAVKETAVSSPTNTCGVTLTPAVKETVAPSPTNTCGVTLTPAAKETATPKPTDTISATITPVVQDTAAPEPSVTPMDIGASQLHIKVSTPVPTATAAPVYTPAATLEPQDPFFQEALAYNRSLVEKGQNAMHTIRDLENFKIRAQNYGFKDNVIGTIYIPRLSVEVPLYLGATDEHMAAGFAVFGMTSVPLGLGDENVAIAGHRGWRGAAMLRDVQMIMMGDPIYITTPWATLTYVVSGIEIVTPTNLNWCKIHRGRTMISLMTCHPYGQHTHRYIVYADLLREEDVAAPAEATAVPTATAAPTATVEPAEATVVPIATAASTATPAPATATVAPAEATVVPTATAAPTATAEPAEATVPTAVPTATAAPTATVEPAEATVVSTATAAPTATVEPAEATAVPTATAAPTATAEPAEATAVPTATAALTATAEPAEATVVPTATAAPTATVVPTAEPAMTAAPQPADYRPARGGIAVVTQTPSAQMITMVHDDGTVETVMIDTTSVEPDDSEYNTDWSNTLILAENSMRPVAYVVAAVVVLVGLWLTIVTIRDAKREKRGKKHDEP